MAAVTFPVALAYGDPDLMIGDRRPLSAQMPYIEMPAAFTPTPPAGYKKHSNLSALPGNRHPGFGYFIPQPVGRVKPQLRTIPLVRPVMYDSLVNPYRGSDEEYSGNVPYLDHE